MWVRTCQNTVRNCEDTSFPEDFILILMCDVLCYSVPLCLLLLHEPGEKDTPPGTQTPRIQF